MSLKGNPANWQAPWRVVSAKALPDYRIAVEFVDGVSGIVDLHLRVKSERAGVFSDLADVTLFQQLYVQWGAVTWPNELDLAPDAMHDEIKRNGVWIIC
jgi:hypothetical protein